MKIQYRRLQPADCQAYRQIRLESLKLYPENFGAIYAEQHALPQLFFEQRIAEQDPTKVMLGAFHGQELVGLCGLVTIAQESAQIIQMYVRAHCQGRGIGVGLLSQAKDVAANQLGVSQLVLTVYPHNHSARRAYEKSGFVADMSRSQDDGEIVLVFPLA
ncbi:GNAT family N-acetyltransferase [Photobacterium sp. TY1-4]|uniref:GNAT family N-acetyltransferase n=1 Tax=Photobacterium sp. TY1-4 TaxID=2899122 RepID=UPI0021BE0FA7|nr:GNAT family N-acetyltransferase [Photobacterium sp. TY1-4]UXI03209.1 GNAT family N-acetyltransferase [Photobacterium sp. TY1-4]